MQPRETQNPATQVRLAIFRTAVCVACFCAGDNQLISSNMLLATELTLYWYDVHLEWGISFIGCLASQQHVSASQRRINTDNFTCCHTEIEVADQTIYLTRSQYADTGPTIPSADPIIPGAWQGSHWSANFEVTGMTLPGNIP